MKLIIDIPERFYTLSTGRLTDLSEKDLDDILFALTTGTPIYDNADNIKALLAVFPDITVTKSVLSDDISLFFDGRNIGKIDKELLLSSYAKTSQSERESKNHP